MTQKDVFEIANANMPCATYELSRAEQLEVLRYEAPTPAIGEVMQAVKRAIGDVILADVELEMLQELDVVNLPPLPAPEGAVIYYRWHSVGEDFLGCVRNGRVYDCITGRDVTEEVKGWLEIPNV